MSVMKIAEEYCANRVVFSQKIVFEIIVHVRNSSSITYAPHHKYFYMNIYSDINECTLIFLISDSFSTKLLYLPLPESISFKVPRILFRTPLLSRSILPQSLILLYFTSESIFFRILYFDVAFIYIKTTQEPKAVDAHTFSKKHKDGSERTKRIH